MKRLLCIMCALPLCACIHAGSVSLDGNWQTDPASSAQLTVENGKIFGILGCNRYHAEVAATASSLRFEHGAMTRMMCSPKEMELEDALVKALNETRSYALEGDRLTLKSAQGAVLLTLVRKAG